MVACVIGVRMVGHLRDFRLIDTFHFSPHHLSQDSPALVGSLSITEYDYIMIVRSEIAIKNGWLK